jgi:hypothetical protein
MRHLAISFQRLLQPAAAVAFLGVTRSMAAMVSLSVWCGAGIARAPRCDPAGQIRRPPDAPPECEGLANTLSRLAKRARSRRENLMSRSP